MNNYLAKLKFNKFSAISLFSGAMGLDLGLEKAGIKILAAVEACPKAVETIRCNRPQLSLFDVKIEELSGSDVLDGVKKINKDVDLIVGGPPCQAFSVFGKRRGFDDPRGRVIFEFIRFVSEIRPKAFLLENVRGLMSMRLNKSEGKGSLISLILNDLNELGYRVDIFFVNAVNYGAPQIRERVFLIGNRLGVKAEFPLPTHSDSPTGNQKHFTTLGQVIRDFHDPDPSIMDFSPRKKNYLSFVPPGGNWRSMPIEIQQESMGKSWFLKGGRSAYWRRLSFEFPSPTVVTMPNHAGTSMCHPDKIRALTVGECAAIQGFPSEWKFCGSPLEKYKQIGNAVPIILGQVAGKALINILKSKYINIKHPIENTETHIRPHVRTRQYWKNGIVYQAIPYMNNQNRCVEVVEQRELFNV